MAHITLRDLFLDSTVPLYVERDQGCPAGMNEGAANALSADLPALGLRLA